MGAGPQVRGTARLERDGAVAWLVFDNESRRNALSSPMITAAFEILDEVVGDETLRVLVLRGAGEKAFMSGADISALDGSGEDPRILDLARAIAAFEKPVIAALRGWCLGAGVLLALAGDLRVAADDVRFGIPAAKLGVAYPRDGVERIVSLAGPGVATDLLMTGEPLAAEAAWHAGLVNRLVGADDVFSEAARVAAVVAANAPLTLRASKLTIAGSPEARDAIKACYASADFLEGIRAFSEKRPPAFRGR